MAEKKMDKTTLVVIVICVILLFSWNMIFGPKGLNWLQSRPPVKTETTKDNFIPKASPVKKAVSQAQKEEASTKARPALKTELNGRFSEIKLSSPKSLFDVSINPIKGNISSIELKDYNDSTKTRNVVLEHDISPGALSVSEKNHEWKLLNVFKPIINKAKNSVTLKREFENSTGMNFFLTQKWSISNSYVINYDMAVSNPNDKDLKFKDLNVWVGGIPPIQYLAGDIARSESHRIDVLLANDNKLESVKATDKNLSTDMVQFNPIKWLAISNKYFTCILKPTSGNKVFAAGNINHRYSREAEINGKEVKYNIISAAGRIAYTSIPSNASSSWKFQYYAGPKDIMQLKAFAPETTGIMHLSFNFLDTISTWLLYCLIFLKNLVGSYGWAIILLTVIVKLIFWPITHKSNVSMKKMQRIQPLVKEIREKYKDNKQELNKKTMELYKKEKVNPLGGCLPILVQIPVFFALYWTLDGAIELRHASFLWINDLTRPDTIAHIFAIPLNPLAIAMASTMVLQQKLTPTATDPAQAKMMMLMPVVMLFFLYNMPSGLTLYWTVSQLISIIQLLMNKYSGPREKLKKA